MHNLDYDAEFVRVKELCAKKQLDVVVSTAKKGDQGISIRTFDHVHIAVPSGADKARFEQQKGRAERDYDEALIKKFGEKKTPKVFYYWDTKHDKTKDAGGVVLKQYPASKVIRNMKGK